MTQDAKDRLSLGPPKYQIGSTLHNFVERLAAYVVERLMARKTSYAVTQPINASEERNKERYINVL